jgi:hypothetical protein
VQLYGKVKGLSFRVREEILNVLCTISYKKNIKRGQGNTGANKTFLPNFESNTKSLMETELMPCLRNIELLTEQLLAA